MAATKLLNLIAVSTLAILAASFGATPVSAISVDSAHLAARGHAHAALAKKRRSEKSKRCKPRPGSSSPPAAKPTTTSKAPAVTTKAAVSTSKAAPATTTTKASSGSSSGGGSSSGSGNGKVALAWAQDDNVALANVVRAGAKGMIYNWSPYADPAYKKMGLRPCPMMWGLKQASQFTNLVKPGYADCILGFNEPDQAGQANLDPRYAAQLWRQYIDPKADDGYFLVSPAPTNGPSGEVWLQTFLGACNGCRIGAVAVHVYTTDPNVMISYLERIHKNFGLEIWVTEYACQNFGGGRQATMDEVWAFYKQVKPWLESQSYIRYHAAFGFLYNMGNVNPDNRMLGTNGQPTDLGYYMLS